MKGEDGPTIDEIVESVCRLPLDYHAIGDVSAADLVQRSSYQTARPEVTVERLARCLRDHPDWVEEWFSWSADNRGSPSWYLLETIAGDFQVGFYEGPGSQPPVTITDKVQAAAEFVQRYFEDVADSPEDRR